MFMRENRKKNGAYQPGIAGPASNTSAQKISSNIPFPGDGEDWRFTPDLSSPEAINKSHYMGGLSGDGPYSDSYQKDIPFVGNENEKETGTPLKG